jgi:hypothetical protein
MECIYLRDVYQRSRVQHVSENATNAALLERVDKLERLLESRHDGDSQARTTAPSSIPNEFRSHLPSPETNLSSYPTSSEGFTFEGHRSLLTDVDTPRSSTRSCGTLLRSKSGHERYVPSLSRWSSVLSGDHQLHGALSQFEESENAMPWQPQNSGVEHYLSLLPPASACNELKSLYFTIYAPVRPHLRLLDSIHCGHYTY